jgi:adenylosuccinate lyase
VIERYTLPEMGALWSDEHRLEMWKRVEVLALGAWEEMGIAPAGTTELVEMAACPTPEAVAERELITNHDLAAFVDLLGETAGGEAPVWVHYGLTSSDVLDTAGAAMLAESCAVLGAALDRLIARVRVMANDHRRTYMIGRTHGVWAEPTTLGLKLAGWCFELTRDRQRLDAARSAIAVGKVSGAVGTYAHVPPEIEDRVCSSMGLTPEPVSTQIITRDRHAQFLTSLAIVGGTVERMATEVRNLQRSEVGEAREGFRPGQKGSSAMPHKRNPVLSERLTGMARLMRGYAQVGMENMALWHERDISHSSAERVVLADASICLHYMLVKCVELMENLEVDTERMTANLSSTNGLIFSQAALLGLVSSGMARDQAYRIIQRHAMSAWEGKGHLRDLLATDPEIEVSEEALDAMFSLEVLEPGIAVVFDRLAAL